MSENIYQVYQANPITTNASTDLMYFGQSPYGATDDAAMTYANFNAQIVATGTINALGYYAAAGNKLSPITTSNNGVLITSNTGVPSYLANSMTPGYVLTANSGAPASWQAISAVGAITTIDGDSGSATPSSGILTISGGSTGLTTSGSSHTLSLTGTLAIGYGGTGITSFGTGVQTALGQNVTGSGGMVLATGATLITPASLGVQQAALNMNSNQINNLTDPTLAQDAATKNYVDNIATGGAAPCVAATTGALTVTYSNGVAGVGATLTNAGAQATFALDGQSPTVGQRVLIKNQVSTLQNGIYTVTNVGSNSTNWILTRATDYDTPANINDTGVIPVTAGTVNVNTGWINTTVMVTVGTTAITYIQFGVSFPVSQANGGTGANLGPVNSAVFSTTSGGLGQLSTTLPSGLAATNMTLTTPTLGVASATSISFGGSALGNYVSNTSWTPVFVFAIPGDLSVVYHTQSGTYQRIGNIVVATFYVNFTPTFTTSGSTMAFDGLPFTSATPNPVTNIGTAYIDNVTLTSGCSSIWTEVDSNSSGVVINQAITNSLPAPFGVTNFVSTSTYAIGGTIVYMV